MTDLETRRLAWEVGVIGGGAAVIGGLVSGAYQHARDWWSRPKLYLGFDKQNDKLQVSWPGEFPFDGIVFRVSVQNRGIRPASNCKVFVIDLEKVEASGNSATDFLDSRQAPWAGWSFESRSVNAGVTFYADFLRISKHVSGWEFPFERSMSKDQTLKGYRGIYRFRLVVAADNAEPYYQNIDVKYEGDWNNLDAWVAKK